MIESIHQFTEVFGPLGVSASHVLFGIVILRLYQLIKRARICKDTWALKIGIVLSVSGTMTLAMMTLTESVIPASNEALMFWAFVRTVGLTLLCFIVFHNIVRYKHWEVPRRRAKDQGSDFGALNWHEVDSIFPTNKKARRRSTD